MPTLRELQENFVTGLYGTPDDILPYLCANKQLTAAERLTCYQTSLLGHLSDALTAVYPVCRRLVGTDYFERLSTRYIKTHPSTSVNIHQYGATLAEFLATFPPLKNYPYLPDVARLEWVWHRAFYAADETPFDLAALTHLREDELTSLQLKLSATAHLLSSDYPIHRIWQVNQPDYPDEPTVDLDEGGVQLLIWRQNYALRIDPLSEAEWVWLSNISTGAFFAPLCKRLAEDYPDWDIPHLAAQCIAKGYVNGFILEK